MRCLARGESLQWVVVDVEDVILGLGVDAQIAEQPEQLGAVIGAVIDHVDQHLPHKQDRVLAWEWPGEQRVVPQRCQIGAHHLLDLVPMRTDAGPIWEVGGIERCRDVDAAQFAEPGLVGADEMQDLIAHRPVRVAHRLGELFIREGRDAAVP